MPHGATPPESPAGGDRDGCPWPAEVCWRSLRLRPGLPGPNPALRWTYLGIGELLPMPGTRRPYPPEFGTEAVRLVRESGESITQTAKNLDISHESLRCWARHQETDAGLREGLITSGCAKLHRLRQETLILRQEREILEKAAARPRAGGSWFPFLHHSPSFKAYPAPTQKVCPVPDS
ncbi:MAG: transposase [Bacillota bacterium]